MEFKTSEDRIWLEDAEGKEIAYVEFPEFEPGKVEVTHTVVDSSLQGQGVAGKLMEAMTEELRKTDKKAELTCSYAVKWFAKHEDAADVLIDPEAEKEKSEGAVNAACGIPKHRK